MRNPIVICITIRKDTPASKFKVWLLIFVLFDYLLGLKTFNVSILIYCFMGPISGYKLKVTFGGFLWLLEKSAYKTTSNFKCILS